MILSAQVKLYYTSDQYDTGLLFREQYDTAEQELPHDAASKMGVPVLSKPLKARALATALFDLFDGSSILSPAD